jgi:hypothetical protein
MIVPVRPPRRRLWSVAARGAPGRSSRACRPSFGATLTGSARTRAPATRGRQRGCGADDRRARHRRAAPRTGHVHPVRHSIAARRIPASTCDRDAARLPGVPPGLGAAADPHISPVASGLTSVHRPSLCAPRSRVGNTRVVVRVVDARHRVGGPAAFREERDDVGADATVLMATVSNVGESGERGGRIWALMLVPRPRPRVVVLESDQSGSR